MNHSDTSFVGAFLLTSLLDLAYLFFVKQALVVQFRESVYFYAAFIAVDIVAWIVFYKVMEKLP